uniref:Uncharacterized protein n=1 Tax=Glossina pallidipes TaxID=7398 RepID=A0A1A9Z4A5_GLOPL
MFAHIPIHAHACIYNTIIFTEPMYLNDKPSVRCIAACPEMLSHTIEDELVTPSMLESYTIAYTGIWPLCNFSQSWDFKNCYTVVGNSMICIVFILNLSFEIHFQNKPKFLSLKSRTVRLLTILQHFDMDMKKRLGTGNLNEEFGNFIYYPKLAKEEDGKADMANSI